MINLPFSLIGGVLAIAAPASASPWVRSWDW